MQAKATWLLIAVNVTVFVVMCIASAGEELVDPSRALLLTWGADFGPLTFSGDYWRLLSSMFVHIGIIHIAMNMWALWVIGKDAETLFGTSKFLFIYFISGIAASLTSLYFHPTILSAGASGAIFGGFGSLLAFVRFHAKRFRKDFVAGATRSIVALLVINLVFGLSRPGIDNAAHIGGFLCGIIAGVAVAPPDPRMHGWTGRNVLAALILAAAILLCWFGESAAFHSS